MAKGRVYCAGPLFNDKERQEMNELAEALQDREYDTFLPQRDGLELTKCVDLLLSKGYPADEARRLMAEAIFALDVYQVLHGCEVIVANLNGRVPDEGTVAEAAMAWSRGRAVVGYKADSRSAFDGHDNPLVSGLFGFRPCRSLTEVVDAVSRAIKHSEAIGGLMQEREEEIDVHTRLGGEISEALANGATVDGVVEIIAKHNQGAHPIVK